MRYASVIVDLSAEALDRRFTYSVPDGMHIQPGQQVLVPFGPRRLAGFVVELSDTCDLPAEKVRPILGRAQDYAAVIPELMQLADHMHTQYLCNLVDALRLMIPSELRRGEVREKTRRVAQLVWDAERVEAYKTENKRAGRRHEVLVLLAEGDRDTAELNAQALRALVELGAVRIIEAGTRRVPSLLRAGARVEDHVLTPQQENAAKAIRASIGAGGGRFLLNGVTGSGKTEVYIHCIRKALELGKNAIVLVPEIALTPQMVRWFHARFGDLAAVLHSGLSAGERYDEWRRIRFGEARVVVGARSAIFAPMQDIGIIIVDEEHETTYLSDNRPRYDAREVARLRAEYNGAALVLGSATPSISTFMRAMPGVRPENKFTLLELRQRVGNRPLPEVEIVDMRKEFEQGNRSILSAKLADGLRACLASGGQAILFINRRGYSTFVSCRKCGYVVKCEQCDVSMTYHRDTEQLICHYCGAVKSPPKICPQCGSSYIRYFGAGTQKVAEEVEQLLPEARVIRMDVDTTRGKDAHEKLLDRFRRGEANVLVGTQMIAKGLDFPNVTMVGVISADMSLNLPDYRSTERTFQLLTQVEGRAGRANRPGHVVVQTYDPDHYAVKLAAAQDYRAFYQRESAYRRSALYPPFTQIARIVYTGGDAKAVQAAAEADAETLGAFLKEKDIAPDIVQMRALEAPITLLRGEYRWQIFMKMYFKGDMRAVCERMQALAEQPREGIRAELEVNPVNMY